MKIVQSSWACNESDLLRYNAGWYSPEYNLMSWALSCLQLKKYYDNVVLHADYVTAHMLIETLKLPYTEVICDLDQYNHFPRDLWGLAKIHAYSQQTEPFLHVDGDVFIWNAFDTTLLQGGLIAQNLEIGTSRYETSFAEIESKLISPCTAILDEKGKSNSIFAYNAGILGGSDLDFFQLYSTKAKKLIEENSEVLTKIRIPAFNIYFEQYLFYCLVAARNKKVNVLFDEIFPDNKYVGFGDFAEVPHNKQYLHLIGDKYKRNRIVCQQLANKLRQYYPEVYYRVVALFKYSKLFLKRDYYHFIECPTEKVLLERYLNLELEQHNYRGMPGKSMQSETNIDSNYSPQIIKNIFVTIESIANNKNCIFNIKGITENAKVFENLLMAILQKKFNRYNSDELYLRDITHTKYFELLFGVEYINNDNLIIKDARIEIIHCSIDWTIFDSENFNIKKTVIKLNDHLQESFLAVIPECDLKGYSLVRLDELDLKILDVLYTPTGVVGVLRAMESAFDSDDLRNSFAEFELLINGRIKKMIEAKMIEVV